MRDKHRHFVDRYLTHGNASKAATEAGYAPTRARQTGRDLMRRPDIAYAIRSAQQDRSARLGIDADWVVERFLEVYEACMAGWPRIYRGQPIYLDGELLMEWSPSGAIGALEGIIKVLGLRRTAPQVPGCEGDVIYTLEIDWPHHV